MLFAVQMATTCDFHFIVKEEMMRLKSKLIGIVQKAYCYGIMLEVNHLPREGQGCAPASA